jgi:hypothetical protein
MQLKDIIQSVHTDKISVHVARHLEESKDLTTIFTKTFSIEEENYVKSILDTTNLQLTIPFLIHTDDGKLYLVNDLTYKILKAKAEDTSLPIREQRYTNLFNISVNDVSLKDNVTIEDAIKLLIK